MLRTVGKITLAVLGLAALVVALAAVLPGARAPKPDQFLDYRIENVRIVDVERGVAGPPTSVTLRGGRIAAIGGAADGPTRRLVDGRGKYLIPGLWDMHVHSFQLSPQLHFPLFVANGVTSARDMMDCPGLDDSLIACVDDKRRWTAMVERGELAAPRLVEVASFYFERPDIAPAEARRLAADYRRRGIDSLKTYNRLSPEAYRALAASARQLDMRLLGHLPKKVALADALDAGHLSFEHGHVLVRECSREVESWREGALDTVEPAVLVKRMVAGFDAARCATVLDEMRRSGAWLVPTHVTREEDARATDQGFIDDPRLAYLDPMSRWAFRDDLSGTASDYPGASGRKALGDYFVQGLRLTGAAHRAGVPVLVGTDTAIGGFRYHDELRHLSRAGLSNAAILKAATIDAARYARLDRESGSITVGKRADLVLLDANPLDDIRNTRAISAVWLAGRLYDRDGLDRLLGFVRRQAANPLNSIRLLLGFARSSVSSEL